MSCISSYSCLKLTFILNYSVPSLLIDKRSKYKLEWKNKEEIMERNVVQATIQFDLK